MNTDCDESLRVPSGRKGAFLPLRGVLHRKSCARVGVWLSIEAADWDSPVPHGRAWVWLSNSWLYTPANAIPGRQLSRLRWLSYLHRHGGFYCFSWIPALALQLPQVFGEVSPWMGLSLEMVCIRGLGDLDRVSSLVPTFILLQVQPRVRTLHFFHGSQISLLPILYFSSSFHGVNWSPKPT